jgi:hypothetical protein
VPSVVEKKVSQQTTPPKPTTLCAFALKQVSHHKPPTSPTTLCVLRDLGEKQTPSPHTAPLAKPAKNAKIKTKKTLLHATATPHPFHPLSRLQYTIKHIAFAIRFLFLPR